MKKGLAFCLCAALVTLSAISCSPSSSKSSSPAPAAKELAYPEFKERFQLGALQHRVPFTLADSLIQDGAVGSTMQVFFTDSSDVSLSMTPKSHEIKDIRVTISGAKENGTFQDMGYALAVIWALENCQSTSDSAALLDKILSLPAGERWTSPSGFRYSHPAGSDTTIGFVAVNLRLAQ